MSNCEKKESKFDNVSDIVLPLIAALSLILMIICVAMVGAKWVDRMNAQQKCDQVATSTNAQKHLGKN